MILILELDCFFSVCPFGYRATSEQLTGLDPFGSVSGVSPQKIIRATVQGANALRF